jgi:hypothetical protein
MIFAKVDVSIYSHPKFVAAGFDASGYWILALCYLRHHESSDGFLAAEVLSVPLSGRKAECRRLCERLVFAGLFAKVEGGYVLLHYAKKNQTKAEIETLKAAARQRKARGRKEDAAAVTRDTSGAVTRPHSEEDVRVSRVPSISSSISVSDLVSGQPDTDRDPEEPPVAVPREAAGAGSPVARRPLPASERGLSGAAWLAAFTEGIGRQTGRPCSVGRMYVSTLERVVEHHAPRRDAPGACAWLGEQAAAFAAQWDGQHPPKGLTPDGLERWLNEGRVGPPQFGKQRIVQLPADRWKPDDWSDMDVEVITK